MRQRVAHILVVVCIASAGLSRSAAADGIDKDKTHSRADTIEDAVRVTLIKSGGEHTVAAVTGGAAGAREGCRWTLVFTPELDDVPYGTPVDDKPDPEARFALLLCNGVIVEAVWILPDDIVDLDALARDEADRYIEDVLVPVVHIGVNPAATGLVGLRSWFWIEGFDGSVTAAPISAFGLTIEVRMSSGSVTWDFGDGETLEGDLGRAYPAESTVQHAHREPGDHTITAAIDLVPEYRVDGGPWLPLPNLQATATTVHAVQERQAVVTET
jgi:hypothetical protein